MQVESPHREIRPSMSRFCRGAPSLRVLILQSRHTGTLADMLSSAASSSQVDAMWRAHGSPPFYELVVDIESENDNAIRTWPVTLHAYTAKAPRFDAVFRHNEKAETYFPLPVLCRTIPA